jgi:hypothetical protein
MKSKNPLACTTAPLGSLPGVPKNQAPGTLSANGAPGSDAASAISAVPTRPTQAGCTYRPGGRPSGCGIRIVRRQAWAIAPGDCCGNVPSLTAAVTGPSSRPVDLSSAADGGSTANGRCLSLSHSH